MTLLGNISLLELPKHGFLCSRTTSSRVILPCLDWAMGMANSPEPVMSTFHSPLELSVLELLVSGTCPVVMVLGRRLYSQMPQRLQELLDEDRLLVLSLSEQQRISRQSAALSNQYIATHSATLTFGYVSPEGGLNGILSTAKALRLPVRVLSEGCMEG